MSLELHSETVIGQVWGCSWKQGLCKFAGHYRGSLEMHLEVVIDSL